MRANFDFHEVAGLAIALGKAGIQAKMRASVALRKTAYDIARDAQILAPVDTGFLRSSISVQMSDGGMTAEIGPTAEYGIYQEYGTSTQPPQPFLGPASDRHVPLLEQAIARIPEEFF